MKAVKVYQYRVKDPITGRGYLTRYKLTDEDAARPARVDHEGLESRST